MSLSAFNLFRTWQTPDGTLWAKVYDEYEGLDRSPWIALMDSLGHVHRYKRSLVK